MSWKRLARDGAELVGHDVGEGEAVLFQHGLGGDEAQVAAVFPDGGYRRLTLECRAQGGSTAGDPAAFSLATFADDALAFADLCGVARFVAGGISMGAALALRLAVKHPERVRALILARPAWGWEASPVNMRPFVELARCLDPPNPDDFEGSPIARKLADVAPDNLNSLRKFFGRRDKGVTSRLLRAIASDGPGVTEADVRAIRTPTLVLANARDYVHPLALARQLAEAIPAARFVEIAAKAEDPKRHAREFRAEVDRFLQSEVRFA